MVQPFRLPRPTVPVSAPAAGAASSRADDLAYRDTTPSHDGVTASAIADNVVPSAPSRASTAMPSDTAYTYSATSVGTRVGRHVAVGDSPLDPPGDVGDVGPSTLATNPWMSSWSAPIEVAADQQGPAVPAGRRRTGRLPAAGASADPPDG
jgi:hypothetical protein